MPTPMAKSFMTLGFLAVGAAAITSLSWHYQTESSSFNDQPIARGVGDTATDAIKTMLPLQWRAPTSG